MILILATGIGGAYFSVKMVGIMVGNYPDESFIAQEIAAGEFDSMPYQVYIYLAFMVVLSIAGITTQFCLKKRDSEKKNKDGYSGIL